jgi:hypothetical protein
MKARGNDNIIRKAVPSDTWRKVGRSSGKCKRHGCLTQTYVRV